MLNLITREHYRLPLRATHTGPPVLGNPLVIRRFTRLRSSAIVVKHCNSDTLGRSFLISDVCPDFSGFVYTQTGCELCPVYIIIKVFIAGVLNKGFPCRHSGIYHSGRSLAASECYQCCGM